VAVAIRGARKRYGAVHALRGIDLEIRQGEFFGLLGPNGAGKSTLINILAGLARADAGEIAVLGHDVVRDYRRARRALGVVPQELVFDPFFSVREVLRIQSGYYGLGRENEDWIDELLVALNLADRAASNMRALSGGMKRRVLIAQALVHKPPVVVLDEPTAGVDVELRRQLWQFIQRLHREGHTIVLTTHYLEEAEALCERIAILNHGALAALDRKSELLARAAARTVLWVRAEQPPPALPEALEARLRRRDGNEFEIAWDPVRDTLVGTLDELRTAGVRVRDARVREPDLEDVFMELTRRTGGGAV